jgi:predicted transcriptional regulator
MTTTTFSVRVGRSTKSRLEKLAKSTEALSSLDRGKGIAHERVSEWIASWETRKERPAPKGV